MIKKGLLIVLLCFLLVGCSRNNSEENMNSNEITTVLTQEDKISQEERVDGERLNAIFYNGECYYGLLMTVQIIKEEEPEDFNYLGKISSVIKGYNSPTEELGATYGKVGDEVYHYTDKRGNHYFCTPKGGDQYRCLFKATKSKPGYYDQ